MFQYIIKRLLQGIPLLIIVSLTLFLLMMKVGDPIATMGGRTLTRPDDRERLTRQLGLDKPLAVQYLYWLIGNDWTKIDADGDGIPEKNGTRRGILRGDLGTSLVTKEPVAELIGDRIPKTLILMLASEIVTILFALILGIYSALRQYSALDNILTALLFIAYSMPIFFVSLMSMYVFAVLFKQWGLPYFPTVGMFDPQVGKTPGQVTWHYRCSACP
jgi:peptide/nickel transport system permease protein